MGNLCPNDPEFPDFRATPSLFFEAARRGLLPTLIFVLLTESAARSLEHQPARLVEAPRLTATPIRYVNLDEGPEFEIGDPTPRATREIVTSTSARPTVPFFSTIGADDGVMLRYRARRDAHYQAVNLTWPSSMAPLFAEIRNEEGPEPETGDPTPRSRHADFGVSSTSGNISIEVPPARLKISDLAPIVEIVPSSSSGN